MRHIFFLFVFAVLLFPFLLATPVYAAYAPVVDATTIESIPKNGIHKVGKGETFYSIAWRYGLNYRTLALKNHIKRPYNIEVGEKIYLKGNAPNKKTLFANVAANTHLKNTSFKKPNFLARIWGKFNNEPIAAVKHWQWPARGRVVGSYSTFNKGINISGKKGDPVFATAAGKIVYNGDGLRSYGNLIIIKHNSKYLTAYAHNRKTFVKQGQWVKAGQKIAEMGSTGTNHVILHFEIRKEGAPVNPIFYLSRR